jgi:hypothetical protein
MCAPFLIVAAALIIAVLGGLIAGYALVKRLRDPVKLADERRALLEEAGE